MVTNEYENDENFPNSMFQLKNKQKTILFGDIYVDFFKNGCKIRQKKKKGEKKGEILMDFQDMKHIIKRFKEQIEKREILEALEDE